jgi:hypothetical protein
MGKKSLPPEETEEIIPPEEIEEMDVENAPIAAVAHVMKCKVIPFKKSNDLVGFHLRGRVSEVFDTIYQNRLLPIGDYLQALNFCRSAIFTLKKIK